MISLEVLRMIALCLICTNHLLFIACSNCDSMVFQSGDKHRKSMSNFFGISKHSIKSSLRSKDYTADVSDPLDAVELILNRALFGDLPKDVDDSKEKNETLTDIDILAHYPSGQTMRSEMFGQKLGVHLPMSQYMHPDHCYLRITKDHMQTAVNAFAILLEGTVDDVLQLPPLYVLRSARTISMMKIAREKLVATWTVVKGEHKTDEITFQTLEMYRPLFKYINGREIAKLNLSDERIMSFIGTHADLDRHQVGVVASQYIKVNKNWRNVKFLNLMNNLLCGVPMLYMRTLGETTYLQLSHQIFYHIRSCDPLQRRFFLHIMTRTQVLGKSNSWSASDVARLGLLLTEVDAPELAAINPEAMSGISAQVMMEMAPQNLKCLSDSQLKHLSHKPLNILAKKMHVYQDEMLDIKQKEVAVIVCNVLTSQVSAYGMSSVRRPEASLLTAKEINPDELDERNYDALGIEYRLNTTICLQHLSIV